MVGGRAFADALIILLIIGRRAMAVEQNLALSDAANFFDAGLTALGLLTALITTIMRGRLDAENNTRDLLTYLEGKEFGSVTTLGGTNVGQQVHSLSKALVLVEQKSEAWARQLFSYYGAVSGKGVDLLPVRWLHPVHYPGQVERCKCPSGMPLCKCLLLQRVVGVTEHLVAVAQGGIFNLDDEYDAIVCTTCRYSKCHGFQGAVYQGSTQTSGIASPLGPPPPTMSPAEQALNKSVVDMYAPDEGNTGLVLIDPVNEPSVLWASTVLQASMTKDAADRGSENPFTSFYQKALEGEEAEETGREEWGEASWWLSRGGAFLIALAVVVLFRTDAFSSVLLARRALRGYVVDSTGTKLPLEAFCGVAQCEGVQGVRRAFVVLKPKRGRVLVHPQRALWTGTALEALVMVLWLAAIAATPWFRPVGSSYINRGTTWATAIGAAVAGLSSCANTWWWLRSAANKYKWAVLAVPCTITDAIVVSLAIIWMVGVARARAIITAFRGLMLLGALFQWMLGVQHLGAMASSFRGHSTIRILPYALTYVRLLALVAGAGSWA